MNALEHKIPPPVVTLVAGLAMWATARYTPHLMLADAARLILAAGALIAGLAFLASGFLAFSRARTTINPVNLESATSLVTTGIFRISRNPMYVGFTALLTAWACYLAAPWALIGVATFVLFTWRFQILPEERVMRAKFGSTYEEYQRQVPRWL